ncbi:hypothetical protein NW840_05245, partial [Synechococcus sp. R5-13]|uniref:hypothetical protein n=2 Tax=unclassified Synechococcus TaxID=2626047 RepID=UPI0039C2E71E
IKPKQGKECKTHLRGIRKKVGKKSCGEGVLGLESLVAQGIEGSDERIGLCGFWRIARAGVDTVWVLSWKQG